MKPLVKEFFISLRQSRLFYGALLIPLLVLLILARSAYRYHMGAREEIMVKIEQYQAQYSMMAKGEDILTAKKIAEERLLKMEKGLLDATKPSMAAAMLQETFKAFSSKKGITITSEKALNYSEKGRYIKIPVEFQFRAGLAELKDLLYDIKAAPVVMGVKEIRIKSPRQNEAGRLDVSLVIEGAINKK
ncbi:MAG: hypothetical protein HYS21_11405 [Deltaproteobacteria bacterium]|nr:hypothetical protein [Deltaproteobacteria bacterium]